MSKTLKLAASTLTAFAGISAEQPKSAGVYDLKEDHPNADPKLQALVGDPNAGGNSMFAQTSVDVGENQLANPMSPVQGDEIFFTGLIPGARFAAHDGTWWDIESYEFEGAIRVSNPWRPRQTLTTSIDVIRKSIYAWLEPFYQVVPPAPLDADYGILDVRVVK